MGMEKKAENAAEKLKGKVKKETGQAADDPYLEAEGRAEQSKGGLKQAAQNVKDAFKD